MKKLKICAILLIGFMIMGGTASAWNSIDHVKAAPNGKGDLIIFPWYYTYGGGWETKLSVINTSNTYSTVAKVVLRSHNYSQEIMDFLIYLSPNDVWTGFLRTDASGAYLASDDDSILWRTPGAVALEADFASKANPVKQPLFSIDCPTEDSNAYGYVEVIEAAATTGLKKITGTNRVAKADIYSWYLPLSTTAKDDTPNILTGYHEFINTIADLSALSRAEIFADWDNTEHLTVMNMSGITGTSRNTIGELEAAMAKSDVVLPYLNSINGDTSLHWFTFPTKLSWEASACDKYAAYPESPYFMNLGKLVKCEDYMPNVYDLMENTTTSTGSPFSGGDPTTKPQTCEEVNLLQTKFDGDIFREGWIRYNWATTPSSKFFGVRVAPAILDNSYTGTPVLPLVLYIKAKAITQAPAAFDDGVVTEGGVIFPFFQNSQYLVPVYK